MFLFLVLAACRAEPAAIGDVVSSPPGTSSETHHPALQPMWGAPVLGLSSDPWTQTAFMFKLALDDDGELLVDQPHGDEQPMLQIMVTSQRLTDPSDAGHLVEFFGGVDYVTVGVVDMLESWLYDSSQLRQGMQVQQLDAGGNVLGYMQPVEGTADATITFERCDGCDPPP